ncbi:MAG: hypothetical protein ACJAVV_003314 [Alphaproteobacteria bacterium]|jgi:hypothetical protein
MLKNITRVVFILLFAVNTMTTNAFSSEAGDASSTEAQAYRFFELGVGARVYTPLLLSSDDYKTDTYLPNLRFGIKWENGIFINFGNFGTRGNGVGYNFYDYGDWEFDALIHLGLSTTEIGRAPSDSEFRFGFRATHYSDDAVFRVIASPLGINSEDDGFYLGSWYVKNWQVKNWNIHGIAGASYFSEDILDNRYSVNFFQETANFRNYQAGAGVTLEFELGVSYALSEDFVFEASAGQTVVSDAIFDNPFVDKRGQSYASVGFFYVF